MVKRQPADEDIGGTDIERRAHRADIGQQIGMAEHHPLGVAGAAGGILDQRRGLRTGRHRCLDRAAAAQPGDRQDMAQVRRQAQQQRSHFAQVIADDQETSLRIAQDARLSAQMVLHLRAPGGRIHRHRNPAGIERPAEGLKETNPGAQHDADPLPRGQTRIDQPEGEFASRDPQPCIAEQVFLVVLQHNAHMRPVRMRPHMVFQHLNQGLRGCRSLDPGQRLRLGSGPCGQMRGLRTGGQKCCQQVARRLGLGQQRVGQPHAERLAQLQHQFRPAETVKSDVAFQMAVKVGILGLAQMRVQLLGQGSNDPKQFCHRVGIGRAGSLFRQCRICGYHGPRPSGSQQTAARVRGSKT